MNSNKCGIINSELSEDNTAGAPVCAPAAALQRQDAAVRVSGSGHGCGGDRNGRNQ